MLIIGLTGSIGMGKSNAARMLCRLGLPVHDADAAVHRLLGPGGGAVRQVAALFPSALVDGRIDRKRLGDAVFGDLPALRKLEAVLHPMVRRSTQAFLDAAARRRAPVAVLDVPLLFENNLQRGVDRVIVTSAPPFIQRQRVLARRGMTVEKFNAILARQTPDRDKRRLADVVVKTGGSFGNTFRQLKGAVRRLRGLGHRPAQSRSRRPR